MKNVVTSSYINGDEIHEFEFYEELSAANKVKFVNSVTSILVDGDNYNSIIHDIIFDFYIVDVFVTDEGTKALVNSLITSENFLEDVEKFLDETNIAEIIKAGVGHGLVGELSKAVNLNLEYLTGIHPNRLNESLANLVDTIERKISEVDLSAMTEMAQLFAESADDFTTENIVKAYMNSDMHKSNLEEIEESKKRREEFAEKLVEKYGLQQ